MRAVFLSYEEKIKDGNYIFVAKEGINEKSHNDLKRDFEFALKRLDVLKWNKLQSFWLDFIKSIWLY